MRALATFVALIMSFTIAAQIYIPNAITPNNDGHNDELIILCNDSLLEFDFQIFTNNGEVVFHSNNVKQAWVGGIEYYAPISIYNYVMQWRTSKFSDLVRQYGHITVLR